MKNHDTEHTHSDTSVSYCPKDTSHKGRKESSINKSKFQPENIQLK